MKMCMEEALEAAGGKIAVIAKTNMSDGFKGGNGIEECLVIAKELERCGLDALVLSGGFVSRAPMYVMRGYMPIKSMTYYMHPWWLKYGVKMIGKYMIPAAPFREVYFLEDALKFRAALKMPLIYVGGLVSGKKIEEVLGDGFQLVQMGRALLNTPDFVNRLKEGEERCNCSHSNYCIARMYTLEMACHQHLKEKLPCRLQKEIDKLERM